MSMGNITPRNTYIATEQLMYHGSWLSLWLVLSWLTDDSVYFIWLCGQDNKFT